MNRESVLRVADAIEQHSIPDLGFNMRTFYSNEGFADRSGHNCGTVACIAGWGYSVARRLNRAAKHPCRAEGAAEARAMRFMRLSPEQAEELFLPGDGRLRRTTPAQAVAVLRHLAETGEVDWKVADTVKP